MSVSSRAAYASTPSPAATSGADRGSVVSGVVVHREFQSAEDAWRAFETDAVCTPYHRFDWMECWFRHIGAANGLTPAIVEARADDGSTLALWPMATRRTGPGIVAGWMGGKHVNYHMGLYRRDAIHRLDRDALTPMLQALRREAGAHAVQLVNQPREWRGFPNPLAALPHQPSSSFAYSLELKPDFEALYQELRSGSTRKKLRRAERQMSETFGSCRLRRATTPEEADRVLDAFFAQKTERMRDKGQVNIFADPGVMAFFREIGHRGCGVADPLLGLFWLEAGGKVAATWAGTIFQDRLCGMINSFGVSEFAAYHPGEIVLRQLLEHACEEGLQEFDLGVGEADYKDSWCPRTDPLFDSFLPLSPTGTAYVASARAAYQLKRRIKRWPAAQSLLRRLR